MNLFGKTITLPFSAKTVAANFTSNELLDLMLTRVYGTTGTGLKTKARELAILDNAQATRAITIANDDSDVAVAVCEKQIAIHTQARNKRVSANDEKIAVAGQKLARSEAILAATAPQA